MTNITAITLYMPPNSEPGPCMVEVELPGAYLNFSLTAETWQGYSGEGALLESLSHSEVLEDMESIRSVLGFDAAIAVPQLARTQKMSEAKTKAALALLAVSGKLGYDAHDGVYFHRELPDDPHLVAARQLIDTVNPIAPNSWSVRSGKTDYWVSYDPAEGAQAAKCTCIWYLKHQNSRGPCKHILELHWTKLLPRH